MQYKNVVRTSNNGSHHDKCLLSDIRRPVPFDVLPWNQNPVVPWFRVQMSAFARSIDMTCSKKGLETVIDGGARGGCPLRLAPGTGRTSQLELPRTLMRYLNVLGHNACRFSLVMVCCLTTEVRGGVSWGMTKVTHISR